MVIESGPNDWKKANAYPFAQRAIEDAGNCRAVIFTPVSGIIMEQDFWKPFQVTCRTRSDHEKLAQIYQR